MLDNNLDHIGVEHTNVTGSLIDGYTMLQLAKGGDSSFSLLLVFGALVWYLLHIILGAWVSVLIICWALTALTIYFYKKASIIKPKVRTNDVINKFLADNTPQAFKPKRKYDDNL